LRAARHASFQAEHPPHRARFPIAGAWGLVAMPIPLSQPHFLAIANAAAALSPADRDPATHDAGRRCGGGDLEAPEAPPRGRWEGRWCVFFRIVGSVTPTVTPPLSPS